MQFTLTPPGIFRATIQITVGVYLLGVGVMVTHQALGRYLLQSSAADATGSTGKIVSCKILIQSYNFKDIGVIILDLNLPGLDGIDLQMQLRNKGSQIPIIFLTGRGDIHASVTAMKHGAENFLTKPVDEKQLLTAVQEALSHHCEIHRKHKNSQLIRQNIATLTARESEVLRYVISGARNKQIAHQLNIAEKTVKVHRGRVIEKMQARSIVTLIQMCNAVDLQPLIITPSQQPTVVEN